MVWSALSLPVLEPLTSAKMEKLSTITMSCLYAAVSIATANSILGISSAISPKTAISTSTTGMPPSLILVTNFINFCLFIVYYLQINVVTYNVNVWFFCIQITFLTTHLDF